MGYVLLCLGVAIWWGAHLFKRIAPEQRAKLGDPGKGLVALLLIGAIVLMTMGYKRAWHIDLWYPPAFLVHVNNLLMLIALFMMSPAPKRGKLLAGWRHPMLAGFKTWAVAHLLVNGDLASLILFGGLLAWAVVSVIAINRSEPDWTPPKAAGTYAMDGVFLVASVVLLGIVGWIHGWLGPWPFPA